VRTRSSNQPRGTNSMVSSSSVKPLNCRGCGGNTTCKPQAVVSETHPGGHQAGVSMGTGFCRLVLGVPRLLRVDAGCQRSEIRDHNHHDGGGACRG